jgi:O-antigen ligase
LGEKAKEKIVLGWGAGSSTDLVELAWPGITEPHNDYLRIIFEQGFVGLGIFLTAAVGQMALLRREIRRCDGEKKIGFVTAYLALAVLLVVSFTENTIVYGLWYMNPLFAVLGGAYGVRRAGRTFVERPMRARFALPALTREGKAGPSMEGAI